MNSNAFHNIANIASIVLAALTAALLATGCTEVAGVINCSKSWVSPTYTAVIIAVLQAVKIVVNVVRDGVGNLFKPQPPVDN